MNASRIQKGELRRAGAAGVFLSALVVVVVSAWQAFGHFAADIRADTERELEVVSRLKQDAIERFLHEREGDGAVLAARPAIWSRLAPAGSPPPRGTALSLDQVIRGTREAYGYRRILLFDRERRVAYPESAGTVDAEINRGVDAAMDSTRPRFVDLHYDASSCSCYGVAYPVRQDGAPDGAVVGAIYVEVDAGRELQSLVQQWPAGHSSAAVVLVRAERGGVRVLLGTGASPGADSAWRPSAGPGDRRLAQRAVRGETGILRDALDFEGRPVLGVAQPIKGTPWILITRIDLAEAEAPVQRLRFVVTVLACLFILFSAAVTYLLWRTQHEQWVAGRALLAQRYDTAIEASTDGYARVASDGRILEANRALGRIVGADPGAMRGRTVSEVDATHAPVDVQRRLASIQASGAERFRSRWRRSDGALVDVEVSAVHVPDEQGGSFQAFVRDITADLRRTRELQQLNRFHGLLLQVSRKITPLRDPLEILRAFCAAAEGEGGFALAWAGLVDEGANEVRIVAASGAAAEYTEGLEISLDPARETGVGPSALALRERRTVVVDDFLADPRVAHWHAKAARFGLRSSAATPVMVGGRAMAVVNFYAAETGAFGPELLALLDEATRALALACEAGHATRERDDERSRREEVEDRFRRIFDASPLPMQVHSAADRALVAVNRAHVALFGYALEEIAGPDAWFERAYPDPAFRARIRSHWEADVAQALDVQGTRHSPEIALRCRDGSERLVVGHMTAAGEDVIVTWTDMTSVRRSEDALRDSERRFRGMVEQMVAGFYVSQDHRIVYANPRYAAMVGEEPESLVGRDPFDFVEPDSLGPVVDGRARLKAGEKNVSYTSRVRRRDGTTIVVRAMIASGTWGGRPALFAVIEDVSERNRAEQRASDYLKRLESAIQGTLQAVARMVDLRDPYTAGHERRVGLVSADIAREMGWSEERCHAVELVGLVHDIGKVAVPAEILSKPTRLTPTEYDLIKNHAQAGYEILKDVQFDGLPVADIIRQHHERLDGSGYPRGLKEGEILPEARILAVADVLESMASHRPYRPALGLDAALAELEKGRGRLYDAAVVDAVVRMVRERGYRLPA